MNENEEDVVHAGIVSKFSKTPRIQAILEFATDTRNSPAISKHGHLGAYLNNLEPNRHSLHQDANW